MMLVHIGQTNVAERVHNAWLRTIEDGVHTYDIYDEGNSKQKVGTKEFSQAVVARLGKKPSTLKPVTYKAADKSQDKPYHYQRPVEKKELVGVDVFIEFLKGKPNDLAAVLQPLASDGMQLEMISSRGMKVWPQGMAET